MQLLHLVYQHWFITILILLFGVAPVMTGLGGFVRATIRGFRRDG